MCVIWVDRNDRRTLSSQQPFPKDTAFPISLPLIRPRLPITIRFTPGRVSETFWRFDWKRKPARLRGRPSNVAIGSKEGQRDPADRPNPGWAGHRASCTIPDAGITYWGGSNVIGWLMSVRLTSVIVV